MHLDKSQILKTVPHSLSETILRNDFYSQKNSFTHSNYCKSERKEKKIFLMAFSLPHLCGLI